MLGTRGPSSQARKGGGWLVPVEADEIFGSAFEATDCSQPSVDR